MGGDGEEEARVEGEEGKEMRDGARERNGNEGEDGGEEGKRGWG